MTARGAFDGLAACDTLANEFSRGNIRHTYETRRHTDAIDATHQKKEKTQRMLWRQLVKRHLDAPQRVLDDRVRVGRVAPEF